MTDTNQTGSIAALRLPELQALASELGVKGISKMRKGDLVISSGLGHRFPRGYPVGTIADIGVDPGEPFARVEVKPSARLGQSREVLLVWPQRIEGEVSGGDEVASLP